MTGLVKTINTEEIYKLIQKRMKKRSIENPDLGHRNFILPSYHTKTYYKGATSLQMQTETSVKVNDSELRNNLNLLRKTSSEDLVNAKLNKNLSKSNEDLMLERARHNVDPASFTKAVLQNCGEIRLKDKNVITTERGSGFMRKFSLLNTTNPAKTFFGTKSK